LPHPGKLNPRRATFDNQLIELESVDSTNNYAMARIHEGMASDGMVCLARHQWGGKGQRGKTWLSEPGQNLIMSLVIEPGTLLLSQQFIFSAAIGLGILDFLRSLKKKNWSLKWPNDVYWDDRKAAGILIESVVQGNNWTYAVVGIGMNLNQESFPPEIPNPVTLKQITGKNHDPVSVAREMVPAIRKRIAKLRSNPDLILDSYNHSLYKKNQKVALKKGNDRIETNLQGVDMSGFLLTDNGPFNLGEIEFLLTVDG
jgi:BirA family biotin operon repressor/biotin-[acetyl-CoA-carboxylase] ligase